MSLADQRQAFVLLPSVFPVEAADHVVAPAARLMDGRRWGGGASRQSGRQLVGQPGSPAVSRCCLSAVSEKNGPSAARLNEPF